MDRKLIKLTLVVWIVLIVSRVGFDLYLSLNRYSLISNGIHDGTTYIIIVHSIVLLLMLINRNGTRKWPTTITVIGGIIVLFYAWTANTFSTFLVDPPKQYYFTSPDGKYKLLIEEISSITDCEIMGYPVKNDFFKIEQDFESSARFGEPDNPILKGNYHLKWDKNKAIMSVYSDSSEETFTVVFD